MDLPFVARVALIAVFTASGAYCLLRCARWFPLRRIALRADQPCADQQSRADQSRADQSRADRLGVDQSRADRPGVDQSRADQFRADLSRADRPGADQPGVDQACAASADPGCHDGAAGHGRTSDVAQVAMSVAMVAMLATGFGGDRWGVQVTVFAVAGTWFLTRALPTVSSAASAGAIRTRFAGAGAVSVDARTGWVNHAVMMVGTAWMSFAMSRASPMDMAGSATVGASTVTSLALAGYLVIAAIWWGRRSLVTAGSGGFFGVTGATTCHAVTSAAMAAVFVLGAHA